MPLGASADRFSLMVLSTTGVGYNRVGIAEIGLGDLRLTRVARMPQTLTMLAGALDAGGHALLGRTPLDVVLSRVRGTDTPLDDAETSLQRAFSLPDARTYRWYGLVRPGAGLTEADYDALAGLTGDVTASSTSQALGLPLFRSSLAVDGDLNTAWVPSEPVVGQSMTVRFPSRTIDHVDVIQDPVAGTTKLDSWATRVGIAVDGTAVAEATAGPGGFRIPITPTKGSSVTLTILARNVDGKPVRISELGVEGVRATFDQGAAERACVTVGTIDGRPLRMHPLAAILGLDPAVYGVCPGSTLDLSAGPHQLRGSSLWVADTLVLRDTSGEQVVAPGALPAVDIQPGRGSSLVVSAEASTVPWVLQTGQSYDSHWRATSAGKDLGRPIVVDGYAAGWLIPAGAAVTIEVTYGPQRASSIALLVSGVAVVGGLLLLLLPLPLRRRTEPSTSTEPAPLFGPTARPAAKARRPRVRLVASGILAVVVSAFFAGPAGEAFAVAAVLLLGVGVGARLVIRLGVLLAFAVPVVWVVGNRGRWGIVNVDLVQLNPWAGWLAAGALVLLSVGVLTEDAGLRRGGPPRKTQVQ